MGAVIGGIIIGNILSGAIRGALGGGVTAYARAKSVSTSLVSRELDVVRGARRVLRAAGASAGAAAVSDSHADNDDCLPDQISQRQRSRGYGEPTGRRRLGVDLDYLWSLAEFAESPAQRSQ